MAAADHAAGTAGGNDDSPVTGDKRGRRPHGPGRKPAPGGGPPAPPRRKQLTLRLHPEVWRTLHIMSVESERSIHSFLEEGVDAMLVRYGHPTAGEIVSAGDGR